MRFVFLILNNFNKFKNAIKLLIAFFYIFAKRKNGTCYQNCGFKSPTW